MPFRPLTTETILRPAHSLAAIPEQALLHDIPEGLILSGSYVGGSVRPLRSTAGFPESRITQVTTNQLAEASRDGGDRIPASALPQWLVLWGLSPSPNRDTQMKL